jgi:hypothetical protein
MATKHYTAEEFRKISKVNLGWHEVESDGYDVVVTVQDGDTIHVRMFGTLGGNLKLKGKGNGCVHLDVIGKGNAYRLGKGQGHCYRDGVGEAYRIGKGVGNAYINGEKVQKKRVLKNGLLNDE